MSPEQQVVTCEPSVRGVSIIKLFYGLLFYVCDLME